MEELACKKEAKEDYAKWVDLEETHWRQVSRELWLKAAIFRKFGVEADIGSLPFNQISVQEAEMLEAPFTEGEVQSALMEMNGDKALGLDGFSVLFWQCCWDFVKEVILEMFKEFHDQNMFLKSINNTFLVLIPKKGGPGDLGDFRPISLLGGLYKLLAKVLANRLKKVIDKVVSHDQNAFVTGRQILDASLIANEVIDNWKKKGDKGRSVAEVDVVVYFHSQIFSYGEWNANWFLFEFKRAAAKCKIQRDRGRAVHIAHLLFADDTIVFSASGLRINLAKSEIIPVGEVQRIEELAVELGCRVGQLPTVYLGLPLGVPNKAAYGWDGVEEKMRRRIALWKSQYISKGGRITLIKSSMEILKEARWCWDKMVFNVGKGNKIKFWTDVWCGDAALSQRFPHLYILAANRNAKVEDLWDQNVGEGGWNLCFIRDFNDWEVELVGELLQVLRGIRMTWRMTRFLGKEGGVGSLE
ncbi:Transposon TX1 uncharacterized 149 kDa protein [Vitis vinifera]|uniref:Transposon TX1 uncharacterized 149 kDa protein n=1 Tax=Vitis vinifera TaxID=29760 RepID=A0A438IPS3_VITVI|nr:Transposon TX1 uncharacterized 149 kDa protein [Vitis vinifera]